jgi:hypothetical protein
MTPQQNAEHLRNIIRDVRFLKYRAGAPHPITGWIFLAMLAPLLLIFVAGLSFEVGIQCHLMKPVPKRVPRTEEPWPAPRSSRFSTRSAQSELQPSTGETK